MLLVFYFLFSNQLCGVNNNKTTMASDEGNPDVYLDEGHMLMSCHITMEEDCWSSIWHRKEKMTMAARIPRLGNLPSAVRCIVFAISSDSSFWAWQSLFGGVGFSTHTHRYGILVCARFLPSPCFRSSFCLLKLGGCYLKGLTIFPWRGLWTKGFRAMTATAVCSRFKDEHTQKVRQSLSSTGTVLYYYLPVPVGPS